ncbi:nuclear transport factor 2 family protein [Streptomyces sp. NPDC047974]|uniref:nuclear transport factor 2 family protein n=1 Tax=Streptomyces sp. NPDC047974 TaxID=3154343 RepID=UPI0033F7CC40
MTADTRSTVEAFFARVSKGDVEGALEFIAEPVDWFTPGDTALIPWMGRRESHSDIRDFFRMAGEHMTPESFETAHTLVDGELAVVLGSFRYRVDATGKSFSSEFALELRVTDGRITRYHMHEDSYAISLAFH